MGALSLRLRSTRSLPLVLVCLFIFSTRSQLVSGGGAAPPPPPRRCTNGHDCSLNGLCAAGTCVCDAAWHGAQCAQLSLVPAATIDPAYPPASWKGNTTSWGGSVVRDEDTGKFHMYLAEMLNGCGMNTWTTNSIIRHAVATSPRGKKNLAIDFARCPMHRVNYRTCPLLQVPTRQRKS